jgi:hypothetical protein
MAQLAGSELLFAGAIVYFAAEVASTSDISTKPAYNNAAWKELFAVQSFKHKPVKVSSEDDIVTAEGWGQEINEFTVADDFEITSKRATDLFRQLQMGLSGAITHGTAQSPFVTSNRRLQGWIKIQERKHTGTDHSLLDAWIEIRVMETPDIKKGVQEFKFACRVLRPFSTLNAYNLPA